MSVPKPTKYLLWISLAILIKGLFFWIQVSLNYENNSPLLGFFTADSHEYYDSMNSFYETGVYSPDVRMPGLGIVFLLLRFFFERNMALDIILIMQWLLSGVAIYTLCLTASKIAKKESVFYCLYILILSTHYIFLWNVLLLTESFCISFLIFSMYFLNRYFETQARKYLFIVGFFLTWCVFLRPVFFLFYGIIALFLLVYFIRNKVGFKNILINGILFLGLFVVLDSAWIIRNYNVKHKFIFLNDISSYSELSKSDPLPAVYFFLEAWGGDLENERHWFEMDQGMDYRYRDTTLPQYIYTSKFNKDSLLLVKQRIKFYNHHKNDSIVALINNSLQRYTHSIRSEKPFLFYIGAGLINYKKMLMSGYCNYDQFNEDFNKQHFFTQFYRLTRAILFYLIFFTGAIFSFVYFFSKNGNSLLKVLIVIAHVNLFYIAFFFRTAEFRYVLPSTVIFIMLTGILICKLKDRLRSTSSKQ